MPPNWEEIKRCPIWSILGITECNNCDTLVQCWGEESILPEPKNDALEQMLGVINREKEISNAPM